MTPEKFHDGLLETIEQCAADGMHYSTAIAVLVDVVGRLGACAAVQSQESPEEIGDIIQHEFDRVLTGYYHAYRTETD